MSTGFTYMFYECSTWHARVFIKPICRYVFKTGNYYVHKENGFSIINIIIINFGPLIFFVFAPPHVLGSRHMIPASGLYIIGILKSSQYRYHSLVRISL